jgi:hypothetical protein
MMHLQKKITSTEIMFYLITAVISTGILLRFSGGISGNDYWWHIKVGEWILENHTVPKTGIFSWYAMENNLDWVSHEWLSEVLLYLIHMFFGNTGIFVLSLVACIGLFLLIVHINKHNIQENLLLSLVFLFFSTIILPIFFYGRPQIFSAYLLYFSLLCLYRYSTNNSKSIYFLPIISILWSNLHGGSANMPYILCLLFAFTGIFQFSFSRLESNKNSFKQSIILFTIALVSFMATSINPHGLKMLAYPYTNMGDTVMLSFITEWLSPDAKNVGDLIACFLPILFVSLVMLLTNKKIKFIDLLMFLVFTYLAFRSFRFILLFYIASTFFVFEYMPLIRKQETQVKLTKFISFCVFVFLVITNVFIASQIYELSRIDKLISIPLDNKYINIIKEDNPKRLFNDYNFGEILIYNDISTFVDARADIFSKYNLIDTYKLLFLRPPKQLEFDNSNENLTISILDVEGLIRKYKFDAFLVKSNRSLATYLLSHPEKYKLQMSDENTSYFTLVDE